MQYIGSQYRLYNAESTFEFVLTVSASLSMLWLDDLSAQGVVSVFGRALSLWTDSTEITLALSTCWRCLKYIQSSTFRPRQMDDIYDCFCCKILMTIRNDPFKRQIPSNCSHNQQSHAVISVGNYDFLGKVPMP